MNPEKNPDKVQKLRAQVKDVRIGGKGTARRKRKHLHKTAVGDDRKLQNALKRLAVNSIHGIEEVIMFKADGNVLHFNNPKVQASPAANTFAIMGHAETKKMNDVPGIINHLGMETANSLQKLVQGMTESQGKEFVPETIDEEDDDVPGKIALNSTAM
ncbi:putative transcription factor BTF3-like 4 [Apostichopus japonicus]|uniref:Transcription factor BTF3 n=1 Tax=Stichopus japonicus TaxID=307972 RepID=A0A2G8LHJ8_STIJA|nr:putative transcription factor BTF3-like 4 [Apostichopus japonicus]